MSMDGWWIVQTTVLPVSTVFFTVLITMAAARASSPDVGSCKWTSLDFRLYYYDKLKGHGSKWKLL